MGDEQAVSVAVAARSLGVSSKRVYQMLKQGTLTGPPVPSGRRASPNGPRVWMLSLQAELERRRHANRGRHKHPTPADGPSLDSSTAAAHELKVALDLARDEIKAEREHTSRVTQLLADAVAALQEQQRLSQRADRLADGYSQALTQLMGPPDVGRI